MFESGLLMHTCGHYGNVLRFMAPLTIEEPLLESGLEVFERTVLSHGQ
jgi:4-aminobutyrate aminotransferase-like enzyme